MRTVCCLLPLVFGCYPPPECAEGAPRNDAGECTVIAASDDTAVQDTGELVTSDFSGPIEIGILAETSALVLEDVCEGSVELTVEGTAVDGTLSCVFGGTVGGIIGSDPFVGTISGEVAEDGSASGPLDMDLAAFEMNPGGEERPAKRARGPGAQHKSVEKKRALLFTIS